ncbi:PfkB family carbohydrate kinase [Anaerococcus cruorum]|uniref:PfkB family carbohydrate kinase n=1 Tax=Anaerococcus sp. WGS1596 TaxID=3366806 RepID=UPI00372CFBDB
MKTLVIGSAIVDIMMQLDRLPKSGEDVLCDSTKTVVGGCAFNVANTLKNLDFDHDLCVPLGKGPFSDIIRKELNKKGYDPMIEENKEDNGYCLSLIESNGERTFITVEGAESHFKKKWLGNINTDKYDSIYISGYQLYGDSGKVILDWIKSIPDLDQKRIFIAPGPMITKIESETMEAMLSLNPILHINELEAKSYTKNGNLEDAIKDLYEKSRNLVFITLGKDGTLFYDGKKLLHINSNEANVIDTVGAGDSHIGAIIASLSRGKKVEDAILFANEVAEVIVGISGPIMDYDDFQEKFGGLKDE